MVVARKILVVDDEHIVNDSCHRILTRQGYVVQTTEKAREGLQEALSEDFDLVITDLKMPDLDGMELVRTLRGERPGLAIVIITGHGTIPSAVEATRLGVSDYLEKPFSPSS
jgi:DNA-binding NtrC family response regulator